MNKLLSLLLNEDDQSKYKDVFSLETTLLKHIKKEDDLKLLVIHAAKLQRKGFADPANMLIKTARRVAILLIPFKDLDKLLECMKDLNQTYEKAFKDLFSPQEWDEYIKTEQKLPELLIETGRFQNLDDSNVVPESDSPVPNDEYSMGPAEKIRETPTKKICLPNNSTIINQAFFNNQSQGDDTPRRKPPERTQPLISLNMAK